jgi:hypothetical protein
MFYRKTTYNMIMNILRRLGLSFTILIFSLSISLLALFISLYSIVSTPQPIKQALETSGIYSVAVDDTIAQQETATSLSSADPLVQQALKQALPPSFLQGASSQAIDSVYTWIQGKTASPDFTIDLTQVKNNFADNLAASVKQKLDALPQCTGYIAPAASVNDALSLSCMPRGVSSATIAADARQEAVDSGLFAGGNSINASSFKDGQGKPITDSLKIAPQVYHYYYIALYLLPLLIVLCIVAIIYWSATKRAGIKRVAWLFITTGAGIMIIAAVEVWLLHTGISLLSSTTSGVATIQGKLLVVLETLVTDMRTWWFVAGAAYFVVGIILLIILKFKPARPTLPMGNGGHNGELPPIVVSSPPVTPPSTPPTSFPPVA